MKHRVYIADSVLRTYFHNTVVGALREDGHDVYDHRAPAPGEEGFRWSLVDKDWRNWTPAQAVAALEAPAARPAYYRDMTALIGATATVLVLPAGNSAHLELGLARGRGQLSAILYPPLDFPEPPHTLDDACMVLGCKLPMTHAPGQCKIPEKRRAEMPAELMYRMVDLVTLDLEELREFLRRG